MRDDRTRLLDILDAIDRIDRYTGRGRAEFDGSELIQTWVVHHIQVIGEACRALSPDLRARFPAVPWAQIGAMRNILVHIYFGVDLDEVWIVVEHDLPELRRSVQEILAQIPETSP